MARIHRIRRELLRKRLYGTTGTDVIEVGDLVVIVSGKARPAAVKTTTSGGSGPGRITTAQDLVSDSLGGVALQGKGAAETPDILVAVDCIAEYDLDTAVASTAKTISDTVEISATDDGTTATPKNQIVAFGATNPIAKLAKNAAIGETTVTIHIVGIDVRGPIVAD